MQGVQSVRAGRAPVAALSIVGALVLAGVATWFAFQGPIEAAGACAAASGVLLLASGVAVRRERNRLMLFLDSAADRVFDGCLLSAIALALRESDPPAAGAAAGALVASFLGAYVRARGLSLGYPVEDSMVWRAARYALVSVALWGEWLSPSMFVLLGINLLTTVVRTSQVVKKERE